MKVLLLTLLSVATYGANVPEKKANSAEEFTLPDYVRTCYEDDPKLGECVKDAISDMMPRLNNGLKSFGIPPLDPFIVPRSQMEYNSGAIQGSVKMKNVKSYGMSQAEFRDVKVKIDGNRITTELEIHFPRIFMEGAYKADVKFNQLKLNPKGYFNVTMTDIDVKHIWSGELIPKKGHKYLQVDEFDMIPEVGDMKFFVDGIFPDPQMNDIAVNFLNQYWPAIYKMMLPETRVYWQPMMLGSMNQFLGRVPFDLLIKKREK